MTKKTDKTNGKNNIIICSAYIFMLMCVYGFLSNGFSFPAVDEITYVFHCVDFSMGFCSKFLPGAVYNFFVREPSEFSATVYEILLLVLFFAAVSVLLSKVITQSTEKGTVIGLVAFYLTGTCSFHAFGRRLGMLDVYWVYFALAAVVFLQNRYLRWFLPVIFALMVTVHFGAVISYIPMLAILMLLEVIFAKEQKEKRILTVLFFVSCAAAIVMFVYFLQFEKKNVTLSLPELNGILTSRGSKVLSYYAILYLDPFNPKGINDYFNEISTTDVLKDILYAAPLSNPDKNIFTKLLNAFLYQIQLNMYIYSKTSYSAEFKNLVALLLLEFPVISVLYVFIVKKFRAVKGKKLERFVYFCALLMLPFTLIGSIPISTDVIRWCAHGIICLFTVVIYILYKDRGEDIYIFKRIAAKIPSVVIYAYFIVNAFIVYDPFL